MNIKKINEILIKVILSLILIILILYLRLDCCVGLSFEEYCFMDQYSISKDIERVETLTKEQQHLMEEINEFATAHTKRVEQANKIQNQLIENKQKSEAQERIKASIANIFNPNHLHPLKEGAEKIINKPSNAGNESEWIYYMILFVGVLVCFMRMSECETEYRNANNMFEYFWLYFAKPKRN
jgi:hypothetical protein